MPATRPSYDQQVVSRADYDHYKATAAAQTQTVAANQAAVASSQKTVEQRMAQLAEQRSKLQQTQSSAPLQLAIREADIKSQQANAEAPRQPSNKAVSILATAALSLRCPGWSHERSAEMGARISKRPATVHDRADRTICGSPPTSRKPNWRGCSLASMFASMWMRCVTISTALWKACRRSPAHAPVCCLLRTPLATTLRSIQRLPVRIRFNAGQKDLDKLRPGMSVEPKVQLD